MKSFIFTCYNFLVFTFIFIFSVNATENVNETTKLVTQPLSTTQIDQLAKRVMNTFSIPGVAIGVIEHGKIVHAQGYGLKEISTNNVVDTNTIFKIASNSKAFTTAALAILVDEGKLKWQGKVVDYLPDFKMSDEWLTKHLTIIDLLTHRSGLGLGAGDLMLWPEPSSFTREQVLHNLRYLNVSSEFRASYAYDNLLYIVAGQLIPAVTGMSWQNFVQSRIMQPLAMNHCFAGSVPKKQHSFLAKPHLFVNGKLTVVERNKQKELVSAAAGGVQCSLNDMLLWANVFLHQGKYGNNKQLFSLKQFNELWKGRTIMPVSKRAYDWDYTHFSQYALGWRLNDVNGFLRVHHTGSLSGMYSSVSFFPELDLGIVILTNQQSSNARNAMMYSIMKSYLPLTHQQHSKDWVAEMLKYEKKTAVQNAHDFVLTNENKYHLSKYKLTNYVLTFNDNWLGDFSINLTTQHGIQHLQIHSKRVVKFVGDLTAVAEDKFLVTWQDRTLEADVFAQFIRDSNYKIIKLKLIPVSKNIDFSYDFQDLNLQIK